MKYSSSLKCVTVLAGVLMLASCGGGDDNEAGSPVALNLSPSSIGWKADPGETTCASGPLDEVFINGGVGPYTIQNSSKTIVTVPDKVENRGDSFVVNYTGNCTQEGGITITIVDVKKAQVVLTIKNLPADAT